MAIHKKFSKGYAIGKPIINIAPDPIVSVRTPRTSDRAEIGTLWVRRTAAGYSSYIMSGITNNLSAWKPIHEDPQIVTIAHPDATATFTCGRGCAIFTGFGIGAAATQIFTFTHDTVSVNDPILVSVCSNCLANAFLEVARIETVAGGFLISIVNRGAEALNGNLAISFDLMK